MRRYSPWISPSYIEIGIDVDGQVRHDLAQDRVVLGYNLEEVVVKLLVREPPIVDKGILAFLTKWETERVVAPC